MDTDTNAGAAPSGTVGADVVRFFFIVREADKLVVATIASRGDARQARRCAAANGLGIGPKYHAREVSRHAYAGSLERAGFAMTPNVTDDRTATR